MRSALFIPNLYCGSFPGSLSRLRFLSLCIIWSWVKGQRFVFVWGKHGASLWRPERCDARSLLWKKNENNSYDIWNNLRVRPTNVVQICHAIRKINYRCSKRKCDSSLSALLMHTFTLLIFLIETCQCYSSSNLLYISEMILVICLCTSPAVSFVVCWNHFC